jgi:hypothetical protein
MSDSGIKKFVTSVIFIPWVGCERSALTAAGELEIAANTNTAAKRVTASFFIFAIPSTSD